MQQLNIIQDIWKYPGYNFEKLEGTNQYLCGMGQINQLNIDNAHIHMCHRPVTKSFLEYRTDDGGRGILNIVKSNKKDFPLRVFDDNPEIEFYLKPVKIQESEIDIRYLLSTIIFSEENNLSFSSSKAFEVFEENLSLTSSFNGVITTLSILGENKFIFERNDLISNGVYTTTYEGATFTFEENQIFEGESSITLSFKNCCN